MWYTVLAMFVVVVIVVALLVYIHRLMGPIRTETLPPVSDRPVSAPFHPFGFPPYPDHTCSNCGHTEKHYEYMGRGGGGPG